MLRLRPLATVERVDFMTVILTPIYRKSSLQIVGDGDLDIVGEHEVLGIRLHRRSGPHVTRLVGTVIEKASTIFDGENGEGSLLVVHSSTSHANDHGRRHSNGGLVGEAIEPTGDHLLERDGELTSGTGNDGDHGDECDVVV